MIPYDAGLLQMAVADLFRYELRRIDFVWREYMQKIGFIGFGLIGGSLAKIWRKKHPDYIFTAYNYKKDEDTELLLAKDDGVLNEIVTDLVHFAECDLIVLSAPVMSNISYLKELKTIIKKDCIVTDVGSVKEAIAAEAVNLGMKKQFIGGHPMAGSEKTGYSNANVHLFENAYYILTPFSDTDEVKLAKLRELVDETMAVSIIVDAKIHDYITAAISHVPHVVASSLVGVVAKADEENGLLAMLAAGGFRDITRIASSSPAMWKDICLTNRDSIGEFMDKYISELKKIKALIEDKDEDSLYHFFESNKDYRDSLPLRKSNMVVSHEILLYVPDEPGSIAIMASILAAKGISIKNMGIAHNREFSDGVLRIEFYDSHSKEAALVAIKERNYKIFD